MENFIILFAAFFPPILMMVRTFYLISLCLKFEQSKEERAQSWTRFAYMAFFCLVMVLYLPVIRFCNYMLVTTMSDAIFEDAYPHILILLAPSKEAMKILKLYAVFRTLLTVFAAFYTNFVLDSNNMMLCRVIASVLTIAMYSYRLMIIKLVIRRGSVQYIPFLLSFFMFVSAATCLVVSLVELDLFVSIPNGFNTCLGAVQLILYAKYRDRANPVLPAY